MTRAVELAGVWKFYGDYAALRDVTLTVEQGDCCALLGRNGAGKTTLLRILAGLSSFERGRTHLFGSSPRQAHAAFLGHGIGVYEDLSARENLLFFGRLAEVPDPDRTAAEWLERVGLANASDMLVRQFSRGMRQRLALARTFLHLPNPAARRALHFARRSRHHDAERVTGRVTPPRSDDCPFHAPA